MSHSIRTRRAEHEEAAADDYRDIYERIEERQRAAYEAEFGPEYCAKHPFKPDGNAIHKMVVEQLLTR